MEHVLSSVLRLVAVSIVLSAVVLPAPTSAAASRQPTAAAEIPQQLAARTPVLRADRFFERRNPPVRPVIQTAQAVQAVVKAPKVKATNQAQPKQKPKKPAVPQVQTPVVAGSVSAVLAYARAQLGKPYVWAAAGPNSFDCSGLVVASYARAGIKLPHQTGGLIGRGRSVSRAQLQPGDLVFPSSGHVGIYLGDGMMIHAPHPGDHVRIAKVYAFYAGRRIIG
ncbi:C40 family peptidase [Dactylosporangium sp. CA-152071]|uniref:C40 family peptidase n=1 Tax=Dactylosporangium sp. CA-152071 TaxID=3239933 RepID=UPI003D8EB8E4